jgi:hypothetical protein
VQDLTAAWAEYTALYNKVDETKRAVSVAGQNYRIMYIGLAG